MQEIEMSATTKAVWKLGLSVPDEITELTEVGLSVFVAIAIPGRLIGVFNLSGKSEGMS